MGAVMRLKNQRYASNETFCAHVPPPALQNGLCCSEVKRPECSGNLSLVFKLRGGGGDWRKLPPSYGTHLRASPFARFRESSIKREVTFTETRGEFAKAPSEVAKVDLSIVVFRVFRV